MNIKDKLEISYWVISLLILIATILAIYYSPIKATKIGRELNEQQSHLTAKMQLFLELFALRGEPVSYRFVEGLNKIKIVFNDDEKVLMAWKNYFNALCKINTDTITSVEIESLKTTLLFEMANGLGYKNLQQLDILNDYYKPIAHGDFVNSEIEMKRVQYDFFTKSSALNDILVEIYKQQLENIDGNKNNKAIK